MGLLMESVKVNKMEGCGLWRLSWHSLPFSQILKLSRFKKPLAEVSKGYSDLREKGRKVSYISFSLPFFHMDKYFLNFLSHAQSSAKAIPRKVAYALH